ncbi:flagellin lysine-N-methylase [Fictibacillus sp. KIGAM418]|uniref:Flagellin lysine-N-methylase n=1 Tax=Fictibacillus marinisediminis TaxID=2878389 RepID=A0A9X1XGJ3_9BACL|nr:flagellin lysine-N-methylase [Fictibacillus marinisediminis]MCK6258675.1 flagellin lysine-N-methylase [Fictibacillus marinisediminis]
MERNILMPTYMKEFSCIGPNCEDTCCSGWTILIDKKTYKNYKNIKNKDFSSEMREKIKKNKKALSDNAYAYIQLNNEGNCGFLDEDKLCTIHSRLGESSLCNTCAIYPRVTNQVNNLLERAGTTSCPEIAKLALKQKDGIDFEVVPITSDNRTLQGEIDSTQFKNTTLEFHYWNIRSLIIEILQYRECDIWKRILLIGMFLKKVQENNSLDSNYINDLIKMYQNNLRSTGLNNLFDEIPEKIELQYKLLKLISDSRLQAKINHIGFTKFYEEFLDGLQLKLDKNDEKLKEIYKLSIDKYYKLTISNFSYIIENYLVNYVFKSLFPLNETDNYMKEFSILVIQYSLIKLYLTGVSANRQGKIDEESVIHFIQCFSRTIEHNKSFLQKVYDFLELNNFNNLASLSIMLRG